MENPDYNEQFNIEKKIKPQRDKLKRPLISPVLAGIIGIVGGFITYQVFGGLLTILLLGMNPAKYNVVSFRLVSVVGQLLFLLLPALLMTKAIYGDLFYILRIHKPHLAELLLFICGLIVLIPLLNSYLTIQQYFLERLAEISPSFKYFKSLVDTLDKELTDTYTFLLRSRSILESVMVILVVALTPAICEESLFRGFIQRSFEYTVKKPIWASLITAIFFALFHFNIYGMLALISLGTYFGFAAYKSNSIFVSSTLHFLNNFVSIIIFIIYQRDITVTEKVTSSELYQYSGVFVVTVVLFIFIIKYINKFYSRKLEVIK